MYYQVTTPGDIVQFRHLHPRLFALSGSILDLTGTGASWGSTPNWAAELVWFCGISLVHVYRIQANWWPFTQGHVSKLLMF